MHDILKSKEGPETQVEKFVGTVMGGSMEIWLYDQVTPNTLIIDVEASTVAPTSMANKATGRPRICDMFM